MDNLSVEYSALSAPQPPIVKYWPFALEISGRGAAFQHLKTVKFAATNEKERSDWISSIQLTTPKNLSDTKQKQDLKPSLAKFADKTSGVALVLSPIQPVAIPSTDKIHELDEPDFDELISYAMEKSLEDLKSIQFELQQQNQKQQDEDETKVETIDAVSIQNDDKEKIEEKEENLSAEKPPRKIIYRAMFQYTPRTSSELIINPGDIIAVKQSSSMELEYLQGETADGRIGFFPKFIAEECEQVEDENSIA